MAHKPIFRGQPRLNLLEHAALNGALFLFDYQFTSIVNGGIQRVLVRNPADSDAILFTEFNVSQTPWTFRYFEGADPNVPANQVTGQATNRNNGFTTGVEVYGGGTYNSTGTEIFRTEIRAQGAGGDFTVGYPLVMNPATDYILSFVNNTGSTQSGEVVVYVADYSAGGA